MSLATAIGVGSIVLGGVTYGVDQVLKAFGGIGTAQPVDESYRPTPVGGFITGCLVVGGVVTLATGSWIAAAIGAVPLGLVLGACTLWQLSRMRIRSPVYFKT